MTGQIPEPTLTGSPVRTPRPLQMTVAAFALMLIFAVIALPGHGMATDTRAANEVVVSSTERLTEDVYLAGGTVDFQGQAQRDVSIAAGTAKVGGVIDGSLNLGAGSADISGTIKGSLRVLSGRVTITGTIEGDVVMAGGQLELTSSGRIGGNVIAAGGNVDLRGAVNGDVTGSIASTHVGGTIQGKIDITTTNFSIANTARITGPVTYTSRASADVDSGAQLTGGIQHEKLDPWGGGANPLGRASGSLLRTLWALVAGAVLVISAPQLANRIGRNGRSLPIALLFGIIALLAVPIVAVLLFGTVVGIPAGVILIALFLIGLYLTQVFVGLAIGRFILPAKWNDGSRGFHLLAMALGVILIGALRFIPVPYVHLVLTVVITIWGIGAAAMLVTSFGDNDRRFAS